MKELIFQDILFSFESTTSTQEEAKKIIDSNAGGVMFVVQAKNQTAGRGRLDRTWASPFGSNIYISIGVYKDEIINWLDLLPLYTAFILLKTIGEKASYKWVNDIIIEGKKVAGVLIESYKHYFIIGIGINVDNYPSDVMFKATSLAENGINIKVDDIFNNFVKYIDIRQEYVINELKKRFFSRDVISINQGKIYGRFKDILPDGSLCIIDEEGKIKEVQVGDVA